MPNEMNATMSAAEAVSFSTFSQQNVHAILSALGQRGGCECEPYQDVFTFSRWSAQRFKIKKGEKGIPITIMRMGRGKVITDKSHPDYGKIMQGRAYPSGTHVFCRCQVETFPKGFSPRQRKRRRATP